VLNADNPGEEIHPILLLQLNTEYHPLYITYVRLPAKSYG